MLVKLLFKNKVAIDKTIILIYSNKKIYYFFRSRFVALLAYLFFKNN